MSDLPFSAVVAGVEVKGYQIPATFNFSKVSGVTHVEVIREPGHDRIIVGFASIEEARLRQPEVESLLRLSSTEVHSIADRRSRRTALWPQTLFGKLERTAAIAGVILALSTYWLTLFRSPEFVVQVAPAQQVVAGQITDFTLLIANRTDGKLTVDVSSDFPVEVSPQGKVLEAREELEFLVKIKSKILKNAALELHASAKAGLLRQPRKRSVVTQLEVWAENPETELIERIARNDGRGAMFAYSIRSPEEAREGLRCEATLRLKPGIRIVGAQPAVEFGDPQVNEEVGNEFALFWWFTPSSQAFNVARSIVYLEATEPLSTQSWESVVPTIRCRRRV